MRVLVLGATGQLGSNLIRALLDRGEQVRALIRPSSPATTLSGLDIECVSGDLNDAASIAQACRGVSVVYHAAGYYPTKNVPVGHAVSEALRETDVLVRAVTRGTRSSVRKVVYASTLTTIGPPRTPGGLADETCTFETVYSDNPYLMAKHAMESAFLNATSRGMPTVAVNPTAFYGPYDSKPTSGMQILLIAKRMMPLYVQGPTNVIDVRDAAVVMIHAAQKGRIGERYIVGNWNTSHQEVNELIARLAGVMPPLIPVPPVLARLGLQMSEWTFQSLLRRPEPIPRFFVEMLPHMGHYDCAKAIRELNYPRTPIELAIKDALAWFRAHEYL
jgi:dihydroflavonol-4-reductase